MLRINDVWLSEQHTNPNNRSYCSGCEACANSCAKKAISMQYDTEGFLYPKVDTNLCIDCGKCIKVCPVITPPEPCEYLYTYAGYSDKSDIIDNCASGGICTTISRYVIQNSGIVFGVKYTDDFINAVYDKAESFEELNSFMTSKYVQSTKNQVYLSVRQEVLSGRLVAFIGCPCDVSALHLFLGKDYDNLITCELICMGVSSYKIAEDYINSKTKKYGTLTNFNSKGKKYGWFAPCLEETYSSGKKINNSFYGTYYGRGFIKFQRPSCAQCSYRGMTGRGDIRVGDFWGIKKSDAFWNQMGVSSIFVRTEKGNKMLNYLREDKFKLFKIPYEKAAAKNNMDLSHNYTEKQLAERKIFTDIFLKKGLVAACKKTATLEFWIKHFVPPKFANTLKHIRHLVSDKKI